MDRTVLVTAIGGDVGHSVLKCLNGSKDNLIGCDMIQYPVGMNLVKDSFVSLPANDFNYINHLLEHCEKYNVTHLIPVSEPEIAIINAKREFFERMNIKVCINNSAIIETCLDKYTTALKLREIGLDVPEFFKDEDFAPNGKKHIVKLRCSCGSKFVQFIRNREELDKILLNTTQPLIIQEYIDEKDEEYTVGVFSSGSEVRVISFKRKLEGGFTKYVELNNDDSIKNDAIIAARKMGLLGSFNIQLRRSKNVNYIFEINPRLSGTVHFRHLLGFRDAIWWLDLVDNKKIEEYENKYSKAIGIREMNEKFLLLEK